MPTIDENRAFWGVYEWPAAGEEWSKRWGGADAQWWGTVYPRIAAFVPAPTILEIAPGRGRWTVYLAELCRRLVAVDLDPGCVDACRERFRDRSHVEVVLNDGRSLDFVADRSIDFAFSFDSLVHAEADVVGDYLAALSRKLAPGGTGFFHHSNLAAYRGPDGVLTIENRRWRSESLDAARFRDLCATHGLVCLGQEVVNWGSVELIDCFSRFGLPDSGPEGPTVENPELMTEAAAVIARARLYGSGPPAGRPSLLELAGRAWRLWTSPGERR